MWILLLACGGDVDKNRDTAAAEDSAVTDPGCLDADGDGSCAQDDCDDQAATVFPNAPEVCDSLDNDCNGAVDDGAGLIYYLDEDDDGYGGEAVQTCDPPDQYADNGADCDDDDSATHPGASELADGVDNDCDGQIDEGVGGGGDPVTEIALSWTGAGLDVSITGPATRYELGMAETGAGSSGWFGESCIPGDEPYGYPDYDYDVCHTLSGSGGFVSSTSSISEVSDGRTLFSRALSSDITYFVADPDSTDCWVSGDDPGYFSDFGCESF